MIAEIKGKKVKFTVGLYFLGEAQAELNMNIDELIRAVINNPSKYLLDLMFISARVEAELDEKPCPITKRDLVEWLDESDDFAKNDGIGAEFSNKLVKSLTKHLPKPEEAEPVEDEKKS